MNSSDSFLLEAFKKVKFTRGKKQERILYARNIKYNLSVAYSNQYGKQSEAILANEVCTRLESVFNDRSLYKSLDIENRVAILFMLITCDFGDSVSISDEDFKWILSVKHYITSLVNPVRLTLIDDIIFRCNRVRSLY